MNIVHSQDGTTIAYSKKGNGEPLILIDGAMCYRAGGPMESIAEQLVDTFTVCTYDRRGRGESGDTDPYDVQREIEDIEALIDEMGGTAHVFGISSGAVLAIKAAGALGGKISKLAIYEPPFVFGEEARAASTAYTNELRNRLSQGRHGDALELFLQKVGTPNEVIAGMRQAPMWPGMEALAPTLAYDDAIMGDGSIPEREAELADVPSLVLVGGNSPVFMQEAGEHIAKALPNAQLRTLQGQTHAVEAGAVAPYLADFFKG